MAVEKDTASFQQVLLCTAQSLSRYRTHQGWRSSQFRIYTQRLTPWMPLESRRQHKGL